MLLFFSLHKYKVAAIDNRDIKLLRIYVSTTLTLSGTPLSFAILRTNNVFSYNALYLLLVKKKKKLTVFTPLISVV